MEEFKSIVSYWYGKNKETLETFLSKIEIYFGFPEKTLEPIVSVTENQIVFDESSESVLLKYLHTSPNAYEEAKIFFETYCQTMLDFLRHYNLLDCR